MSDSDSKDYNPDDISLLSPNEDLMAQRKLTEAKKSVMRQVYVSINLVLHRPTYYENPVEMIEAYEYVMQYLWGFTPDKNYHSYWHMIKGCTCPISDNGDTFGTDIRWLNGSCPWHGESSD